MREANYDDRLDTSPEITSREVLRVLRRAIGYIMPARKLFLLKFLFMCGSLIPMLVAPWPLKILIDHVVLETPISEATIRYPPFVSPFIDMISAVSIDEMLIATLVFLTILILIFGAGAGENNRGSNTMMAQGQDTATQSENMISSGWSLASGCWGMVDMLINIRLVQTITNNLRSELFGRLLRLPMATLDDHRIGDTVYRTMYDTPTIQGICFDLTLTPVVAILGAGVAIYVMNYSFGHIVPELIWLGMLTMPLALIFTFPLSASARRASQASRASGTATANQIEENISSIRAVQSLSSGKQESKRFNDKSQESFKQFRRVVLVNIAIEIAASTGLLILGGYAFFLISNLIILGKLMPGDFFVVLGLFGSVAFAAITIGRLWIDLQNNTAGVRRVFFFLDMENESDDMANGHLDEALAEVRFEHVGLTYNDGRRALRGISFSANRGELIAIVGPTGAGKTSLAYLVPGYHRPTEGLIRFNDRPADELSLIAQRELVSYVFQEQQMLPDSIENNIALGNPAATHEEIVRAADSAGAHTFISHLPDQYQTMVGQSGDKLSVGQKQRIAIARGLIKPAQILILDEPTAALDPETESALIDLLDEIRKDRLIFIIAHRLSTIRRADRILFVRDGQLVEQGDHEDLMTMQGAYWQFVNLGSE